MSETLKPGLYKATVRGVADVTVFVDGSTQIHTLTLVRDRWGNDHSTHSPHLITDARPLIVLDLEDPAESVRLLRAETSPWDCVEQIADQIEAQTKPARIPEPKHIGAHVTTVSHDHAADETIPWTRFSTILLANWIDDAGRKRKWDDLIDPTLIREGVN